jgi:MerR family copper efflux transcriptional regulator
VRIGELAERGGVPPKTIRFWEAERLVPEPARTPAGYRDYDEGAIERLAFIRNAQAAAFTLAQIRTILEVRDQGEAPCEHVARLVEGRLAEVEQRLGELRQTRRQLQELARRAQELDPADCRGLCQIIDA